MSAFYTENRSPELTAEQSRTLYQLTLQYEQRLRNLDVQAAIKAPITPSG